MSFWKKAGELALKAGSAALNETQAAGERTKQYKEEMPLKSDDELVQIIKREGSRSLLMSTAAMQELKSRGYSSEEIKSRVS